MEEVHVEHTNNENRGIFFIKNDGKTVASLTYSLQDNLMTIDHAEVQPAHEGKGLGAKLVEESYHYAVQHSYKVNPLCPFTEVVYDNNPSWSHVRV